MDPSIKGTVFEGVVADVRRLLDEGRIDRDALEVKLAPEDLCLLERKVLAARWYPIESYRRLTELLWEVDGGRDPDYLRRRGARAAERVFPLYLQLRCGEQIAHGIREMGGAWSEQDGNLMASLAGAIFNFSHWRFTLAEEARVYRIEVTEAAGLPAVACYAAEGFIEYTASRVSRTRFVVTHHRVAPDGIAFVLRTEDE